MAAVVSLLQYLFQPTDAQKVPGVERPWQDRKSLFASKEKKVRGKFDTWDGFAVVSVQGASDQGTVSIRRYKPKGGGRQPLEFEEERREDAEEFESTTLEEILDRLAALPEKVAKVIDHLDIAGWIETLMEKIFSEPIFNFWVSRFSERPHPGAFGLARSPGDPETRKVVEANCELDVDSASTDDFQFDLVGVYAFTGWNKKTGRKPPRQ